MFGGLSFMVDDKMVVAVRGTGAMLVRIDPARFDELVAQPGVEQAEMGTGRTMGSGWVSVSDEAISTDELLSFWLGTAMAHNATA